ncbi:MAG: hypothetical protein IJ056_01305 [Acidaminococcaceae bacterium]|nr:hypothetical protein [Acidaminococcaceae bacterium]MBQ9698057.1 hypothetical protein [Acidaminococcaceae bacterium]MBR1590454.1 hypothetical protein [Acidaminococcaceae bacterium]
MKHVFKKSMVLAGILACLFASSAFAAQTTTTPEQDKATQAAALQENKEYDAAHGYTNEAPAAKEAEVKKAPAAEGWEEAVEKDKQTQEEALKANREYDASHGYENK